MIQCRRISRYGCGPTDNCARQSPSLRKIPPLLPLLVNWRWIFFTGRKLCPLGIGTEAPVPVKEKVKYVANELSYCLQWMWTFGTMSQFAHNTTMHPWHYVNMFFDWVITRFSTTLHWLMQYHKQIRKNSLILHTLKNNHHNLIRLKNKKLAEKEQQNESIT